MPQRHIHDDGDASPGSIAALRGRRVLIVNWKDIDHPSAGGAEQYIHEIARRWQGSGVQVRWLTARPAGATAHAVIDGMPIRRIGGTFTVYPLAAAWIARHAGEFDAIIDCQNGIPFFAPLFAGSKVPVVQVVHHVHQAQFGTHFPAPVAAVGRFLEGPVAGRVYRSRPTAAVSVSTREEIRTQLGLSGPVYIVPNGSVPAPPESVVPGRRSARPTICLVTRLAPHKRVDELIRMAARIRTQIPDLQVHVVGGGSAEAGLRTLVGELGIGDTVTLHGRLPDAGRDELLRSAWLTVSLSDGEGWSCSVVESAAWGLPCVARYAPGVRDSVVDGETGWLVRDHADLDRVTVAALRELAEPARAAQVAAACRAWAGRFTWDRSAELLAAVVRSARTGSSFGPRAAPARDCSVVATLPGRVRIDRRLLRVTDEVTTDGTTTRLLLHDCDEAGARTVLHRLGVAGARTRPAERPDLLAGPGVLQAAADRLDTGIAS